MLIRLFRDKKGFTGLEAAITLIAFITVAAVFSYVLLSAGFFATQKGQEVVHTGVQQVSSSVEIIGSIIGYGNQTGGYLNGTTFTIQLAAGASSIDLNKTVITVSSPKHGWYVDLKYNMSPTIDDLKKSATETTYGVFWVTNVNDPGNPSGADNYLEEFEKAQIYINLSAIYNYVEDHYQDFGFNSTPSIKDVALQPNEVFLIELKPPMGATYPIELKVPPTIDPTMVLLQ